MELGIYSKDGRLKLSVAPGDNGACSCGIQEESILAVSFTAFECIALEVYDYADFEGRRYWILERYLPQMNARREWTYSIPVSYTHLIGSNSPADLRCLYAAIYQFTRNTNFKRQDYVQQTQGPSALH